MIASWKIGLLAISTELASVSLLTQGHDSLSLLAYFALHAVASALVTAIAWLLLPSKLRTPRWAVLALLFSFDFFIPVLGVVSMVVVIQLATRFPSAVLTERYTEINEPKFDSNEKEKREQSDVRAGYARRILRDPTQTVDTKLRVLIALQNMRPKVTIPLLQGLLADPSEDIRLLAYSMMDAWEKDITVRLQQTQARMPDAPGDETRAVASGASESTFMRIHQVNVHRKLAELYWEQVDTGLARGDLRTFALKQAKAQCEAALPLDGRVAGVWLLYSRILIELKNNEAAYRALLLARKAGMPDAQVLPHLARIAFDARRYDEVQKCMKRLSRAQHLPHSMRQVVRYWTGHALMDVQL
jgi:polysaccharide biosynthesis protein PelE